MLVLEDCWVTFGGSLIQNARFADSKCEFRGRLRNACFPGERHLVADLKVRVSQEVSYETLVLFRKWVLHKSVQQEWPTRVSHRNLPQECPTRVPYKSVPH